jgi:ubiquinone/menaquinone biosynthesis C-methylase UbiE
VDALIYERLSASLKLLGHHRGEPLGAYDEVASVYDAFAKWWDQRIAAPALAHLYHLLQERIQPGASILDAGAGTGERTLAVLRYCQPKEVVALDASAAMLAIARSKIYDPRVRFVQGDSRQLPFTDQTFDVVVCTWVIETLDDPRAAVKEFIRVIKPDGLVLLTFCRLPNNRLGDVLTTILAKVTTPDSPLSHLLAEKDHPCHSCDHSSLVQFVGGFTTCAVLTKCSHVTSGHVPCASECKKTGETGHQHE